MVCYHTARNRRWCLSEWWRLLHLSDLLEPGNTQMTNSVNVRHVAPVAILRNIVWSFNHVNLLWAWSTPAHVMAHCLMAPSHYLSHYWTISSKVLWQSLQGNNFPDFENVVWQMVAILSWTQCTNIPLMEFISTSIVSPPWKINACMQNVLINES